MTPSRWTRCIRGLSRLQATSAIHRIERWFGCGGGGPWTFSGRGCAVTLKNLRAGRTRNGSRRSKPMSLASSWISAGSAWNGSRNSGVAREFTGAVATREGVPSRVELLLVQKGNRACRWRNHYPSAHPRASVRAHGTNRLLGGTPRRQGCRLPIRFLQPGPCLASGAMRRWIPESVCCADAASKPGGSPNGLPHARLNACKRWRCRDDRIALTR